MSKSTNDDSDGAPTCCVALRPGIILRNLIVPENKWNEFPRGLECSITDYFLYQPSVLDDSRKRVTSPALYQLPYEDVWIQTMDRVKLHAYLILQKKPDREHVPTIIYFHGNAGNIGDRLGNANLMYIELKSNILLVEYRGYGLSEGIPSEKGLYRDSKAAFEYVDNRNDLDSDKIFVFGRSLGGAVAIDLASRTKFRNRVAGLIVENTFTSIPDLAKSLFPLRVVKWAPTFCFKNKYKSISKISSVKCPTLFISGSNDEIIPAAMMPALYQKCTATLKRLEFFPGCHNDTWECEGYTAGVLKFIAEVCSPT